MGARGSPEGPSSPRQSNCSRSRPLLRNFTTRCRAVALRSTARISDCLANSPLRQMSRIVQSLRGRSREARRPVQTCDASREALNQDGTSAIGRRPIRLKRLLERGRQCRPLVRKQTVDHARLDQTTVRGAAVDLSPVLACWLYEQNVTFPSRRKRRLLALCLE